MGRHQSLLLSTILAVGLSASLGIGLGDAQDTMKKSPAETGSGLKPDSGQINPGVAVQKPAGSPPGMNDQSGSGTKVGNRAPTVEKTAATNEPIPSPQEARAAFAASLFKDALPGDSPAPSATAPTGGDQQKVTGQGTSDPAGSSAGHAAIGGALSPGASAAGSSGSSGGGSGGTSPAPAKDGGTNTVGAAGSGQAQTAAAPPAATAPQAKPQANGGDEPRMGPIGAIGQTMPAKFSKRNDTLDRLPTMAWPLPISDQERQQVYQAVMSDKAAAAADIGELRATDQLPARLALADMHPLPEAAARISDLNTLHYVKTKDKVLLVTPATRTIVDVIAN